MLIVLQKKEDSHSQCIRKLQTLKDFVRPLSKKHCLRTSFESQHVKGSQRLVKSLWERFYYNFSSVWEKMIWKISPLVKFEISGIFVYTLAADDKYPARDCENLPFAIQTQSS